ncbi:hypothetical protein NSMM_850022 [Nitrosomonas mobilis]|uniref:Uncharacterized protein n=1 Tax=Nitrosomonas mobilis TaxID=51642 RepID=A0A1G5SIG5_9PROT|nr:hypothetical protein NSMM_850022 [Nitrosomonas mobilis]
MLNGLCQTVSVHFAQSAAKCLIWDNGHQKAIASPRIQKLKKNPKNNLDYLLSQDNTGVLIIDIMLNNVT